MAKKQLSIAIAVAISFCIGLGVARTDIRTFAAAPTFQTKIEFDRAFAEAGRGAGYIDRAHKGDRRPSIRAVSREPALLPNCEPVASPYSDAVLGRVVGRCDA
jgi:hypothetical protein